MAYLIDTNHCSYIINGDSKITDKLQFISSETVGVSIITHAELLYMAERSARKEKNLEAIQSFLSEVEIYFLDEETASIYSSLKSKVFNQLTLRR